MMNVFLPGTTVSDVEKPRDVKQVGASSVSFSLGSNLKVNNVFGTPYISLGGTNNNIVNLHSGRRTATNNANVAIFRIIFNFFHIYIIPLKLN